MMQRLVVVMARGELGRRTPRRRAVLAGHTAQTLRYGEEPAPSAAVLIPDGTGAARRGDRDRSCKAKS